MSRPSDHVLGLVCGLAEPIRSNRRLVMLKAFIDDSRMGQAPVYVLGGWVAKAATWAPFSDAWQQVLWMSPRIQYFKFYEAMNLTGEFHGISEGLRDEKMMLLIRAVEEHKLLGAGSVIPHWLFDNYFGQHPHPEVRNPYYPSLYGLVSRILRHNKAADISDKLELFFDYQPGGGDQMEKVRKGWEEFRQTMPEEFRPLVQSHPPAFLDDREIVALQAADLYAGWLRTVFEYRLEGRKAHWPWGDRNLDIPSVVFAWTEKTADVLYEEMFGFKPTKFTYSFQYGMRT